MKHGLSLVAIVAFGFSAAGLCAQQAAHSANAKSIRQKSHGADAADHKIRSRARIIWPERLF